MHPYGLAYQRLSSKDPDQDFINLTLLEAVSKESPELWERVKVRLIPS